MAASIRSAAMGLPKVSMTRIPLVAFANSHVAPVSHANSSHPNELSKEVGMAMNTTKATSRNSHKANQSGDHHNRSGGKGDRIMGAPTSFEQTFVDQVQADVIHPATSKLSHDNQHQSEMISSLLDELKSDKKSTSLSQHASEAIRMVESHNILKQDKAPINDVSDVDPSQKQAHEHKSKFPF
ncbi:hypothetical protein BGX26_006693 [Mortierella sp. AD094]|nr:hypothetical protein BGX26_006693 [Mortierella sp. AD094]